MNRIWISWSGMLSGLAPKVACMGLAYKPDTDDLHEFPALAIVRKLVQV